MEILGRGPGFKIARYITNISLINLPISWLPYHRHYWNPYFENLHASRAFLSMTHIVNVGQGGIQANA